MSELSAPVCRHFGSCGGCVLQDLASDVYLEHKRKLIVDALARQGISNPPLREIVQVPSRSRRRATLKLQKTAGATHAGFHALRSHEIVDLQECHVLTPALFAAARGMALALSSLLREQETGEMYLVETESGVDLSLRLKRRATPDLVAAVSATAPKLKIVRVTNDGDLLFQNAVPRVQFGQARVEIPPDAFLQPTLEGEAALQSCVAEAIGKANKSLDLFCGCGTFSLPLAARTRVHAVDADLPMLNALAAAARKTSGLRPVATERRDLFKHPLSPGELSAFDTAVLDPPRAGAAAQMRQLAKSALHRIAYVSCDVASFARDARALIDGGYRLDWLVGVDQFLWSSHIELVAAFAKD